MMCSGGEADTAHRLKVEYCDPEKRTETFVGASGDLQADVLTS